MKCEWMDVLTVIGWVSAWAILIYFMPNVAL